MKYKLRTVYTAFFFSLMFNIKEMNAQAVKLSWNHENDIKYYCIYKDTISNPETEISKVAARDTTYFDCDIIFGQKYYYRITAVDSADNTSEFSSDVQIIAQNLIPIKLFSFSAKFINNKIVLKWSTKSESKNFNYEIQKSKDATNFIKIGFVSGLGTFTKFQSYTFVDTDISIGKYYYRLKQIDTTGNFEYSNAISAEAYIPEKFELNQNYPNPFNPETTIKYILAERGKVSLVILDVIGREVRKLVDDYKNAGYHAVKWDGNDNYGNGVSTGIYFCRLKGEGLSMTKKIMLTR